MIIPTVSGVFAVALSGLNLRENASKIKLNFCFY